MSSVGLARVLVPVQACAVFIKNSRSQRWRNDGAR